MRSDEFFPPTLDAAKIRLAAVDPGRYARTRNALDGAVTRLSPYLTHGFLSLPQVLERVAALGPLAVQHKFVYELGWREYFRHVWARRGDGILDSLHPGVLPDAAYGVQVPADLRQARTGVPVIDLAVRRLYATGWLHNHARLWLASYAVHLRKLHWRAGADWMWAHLLDGDLASNHLSWQWVAGTGSHKPYLFNAENVARHAPPAWHSPGSVLDTDYDALERIARGGAVPSAPAGEAVAEPPRFDRPAPAAGFTPPDAQAVQGREVWLLHPWALGEVPDDLPGDTVVIGVAIADWHRARPWSARRWDFVGTRMAALATQRWHGDAAAIAAALRGARRVRSVADPHLAAILPALAECRPAPTLFPAVERRCESFSQWWSRATRGLGDARELRRPAAP